jgi:signal transduction histidine kinase
MSEPAAEVAPRALVSALLRGGVLDERTVSTPGAPDRPDQGATLARAWRYVVLGPILYRVAAFPKVLIGFTSANGAGPAVPVLVATAFAVAVNLVALVLVLRRGGLRAGHTRRALWLDLAVGVALNLVVASVSTPALQPFAVDVSWTWLVGTIAMWSSLLGLPTTVWLLVAAVPFRMALTLAGGLPLSNDLAVERSIGCLVGLVVAVVVMTGFVILVGIGGRFALSAGVRLGVRAERDRTNRMLHDGVLQTLDALALTLPDDGIDPTRRLVELRSALGGEAATLRQRIMQPPPDTTARGFLAELTDVVTEMAGHGLRTQLVAADFDDQAVSEARRAALREAAREAMRNAAKHAGTPHVVLRVEERDNGIAAVVRDHGVGFDVQQRPPGFGISQSIEARLREVGGHGTVHSRPGDGTRVTMWVPR